MSTTGQTVSDSFQIHSMALVKEPGKKGRIVQKADVTVLDNGVLEEALRLAGDKPGRIEIIDEKTAIVWNSQTQKHDMQARRVLGRRGRS